MENKGVREILATDREPFWDVKLGRSLSVAFVVGLFN